MEKGLLTRSIMLPLIMCDTFNCVKWDLRIIVVNSSKIRIVASLFTLLGILSSLFVLVTAQFAFGETVLSLFCFLYCLYILFRLWKNRGAN